MRCTYYMYLSVHEQPYHSKAIGHAEYAGHCDAVCAPNASPPAPRIGFVGCIWKNFEPDHKQLGESAWRKFLIES